jgi:hypothetical protein
MVFSSITSFQEIRVIFTKPAVLVLSVVLIAAAGPVRDVPLSATYRDAVGDGVRSDGLTSFTGSAAHYVNGPDDNALVVLTNGHYRFSTRLDERKPLRRRLCFDFGTQAAPFASPYCADVLIGMHGDGVVGEMQVGDVLDRRVKHSWTYNGYEYRLGFGVDWDQNNTDDTLPAAISCVEPTDNPTAPCTVWEMSSTGVASLARVKILSKGKFGAPELVGYYDMPFQVRFWR